MKRTIEAINAATAFVRHCVWPGCRVELYLERVGPLCIGHADLIHEAIELTDGRYREIIEAVREARVIEATQYAAEAKSAADARKDKPGWIYYIHIGDRIKIGYTTDLWQRTRAYPPGSRILAVHPGTPALERRLHNMFAEHRAAAREWYHPSRAILDHIDRAVAEFGPPPDFTPKPKPTQVTKPRRYVG